MSTRSLHQRGARATSHRCGAGLGGSLCASVSVSQRPRMPSHSILSIVPTLGRCWLMMNSIWVITACVLRVNTVSRCDAMRCSAVQCDITIDSIVVYTYLLWTEPRATGRPGAYRPAPHFGMHRGDLRRNRAKPNTIKKKKTWERRREKGGKRSK